MAQTLAYKTVTAFAIQGNAYSTAHTKGISKILLVSCTGGSSASSVGWALNMSADIKGTVHAVSGSFVTGGLAAGKPHLVTYSSASGSASTGRVYAWSSTTTLVYSKNGQDLSGLKWRWLVYCS